MSRTWDGQRGAAWVVAFGIVAGIAAQPSAAWAQESQEELVDRARGEAALAEAREHLEAHRWQQAIEAFETTLTYLPGNEEALAGLRQAQAELDQAPILTDVESEMRVQLGRAREEFRAARQRASELLAQGDYNGAEREMLTGQIRLRQARRLFSEREFAQLNDEAEALLGEIDTKREAFQLAEEARKSREAASAQREEQLKADEQRRRIIEGNLLRVRQLQMEQRYDEALQVIDEILFMDEHDPAALTLRDIIQTTVFYREFADIQRQKEMALPWISVDAQRGLIPPRPNTSGPGPRSTTGVMGYPEDWAQLSLRRSAEAGFSESAANQRVTQSLSQTRLPVDFNRNSFEQAVGFLSQVTGLNIYVDWKALDFIGVDRQDEITLQLADVSAGTVLDRMLEQVGDELDRPQWAVQDGIVTVSSDQALRQHTLTIVYDIRDLLFEVPYFGDAPKLELSATMSQAASFAGAGAGLGGGFGGGNSLGSGQTFSEPGDSEPRLSRQELVDQIVGIIQENIDPEGWRDLGGDTGTLQELNGNLIITNTLGTHQQIEGLLSQLREIRALQINVESRFLAVQTDWFEQIGVDFDLYFNTNEATRNKQLAADPLSHLSDHFDPNTGRLIDPFRFGQIFDPVTGELITDRIPFGTIFGQPAVDDQGNPIFGINQIQDIVYPLTGPVGSPIRTTQGFAPIGVVQDSMGLVDAIAQLQGFGELVALANPAVAVGIQFLDDVQVDLLIEATQADRRSVVLTAPRLTFFNGQRAWCAIARQVAFISALIPVTGDAAGAFQPIPGVVSDGVVLDCEGVISADRRYVTMTVIVSVSKIIDIKDFPVQGAVGGTGDIAGGATFTSVIQLPEVEVALVQTTVSVPDKGTVLLGGQRLVTEIEVEAGVPVLSKIPFINRFFTNRLTSKEEKTLLIMIRPEIIIQQENEDLLFPGLSDTLGGAASYLR